MSTIQDLGLVVGPQGPVGPTGSSNIIIQSIPLSFSSFPQDNITFDAYSNMISSIYMINSNDFKDRYIPFSIYKINSISFKNVIGGNIIESRDNTVYMQSITGGNIPMGISIFMKYSLLGTSTPISYVDMMLINNSSTQGILSKGTIRDLEISLDMLCYSQD